MTKATVVTFEFPEMQPERRVKELILYIADKLMNDEKFGRVKLAKILYYADHKAYRFFKKPITGSAYHRLDYGPVPENFFDILDEMERDGDIATRIAEHYGFTQKRVVPLREPNLSLFKPEEMEIVDDMIAELLPLNATELSIKSHGVAWELAEPKEQIPYESGLLSDETLTQEEINLALQLAKEHGLR